MNAAVLLAVAALATEMVVTTLLWTLAGVRGFRRLRWFGAFAAAAACFSLTNIASTLSFSSASSVIWAGRLGGLAAACATTSWLCYARVRAKRTPLAGVDGAIALLALTVGVLCLVPGVIYTDGVLEVPVRWFGVTYRIITPTRLAGVAYLFMLAPLLAGARHIWGKGSKSGMVLHLAALLILFATAVNDSLVSMGAVQSPYLVEISFALMVVAVGWEATETIAAHARQLDALSINQKADLDSRTAELLEIRQRALRNEQLAGLGRLAAGVGHEINNPLAYLQSSLEFIERVLATNQPTPDLREAIDDALDGVKRISRVVNDLRIMTPTQGDRAETAELLVATERAIKLTSHLALKHELHIEHDVPSGLWVRIGDEPLARILSNLLANAARAGEADRPNRLMVRVSQREDIVTLTMTDTGGGIAPADLDRIFEPFYTGRFGVGMGLGLAITNTLVTNAGGAIKVESELGVGTTFHVSLPRAPTDGAHVKRVPATPVTKAVATRRLVIIDDEAAVARSLARLLSEHDVEVFTDPLGALARLLDPQRPNVDVVLCDLRMEACSGSELRAKVKVANEALAARFVFITGATEETEEVLAESATRCLHKPVDQALLRRAIAEITT